MGFLLVAVTASASTELTEGDEEVRFDEQGFVNFFIESPGHLVVDASENRAIFPIGNSNLTFADREEYDQFLIDMFGVVVFQDEEGEVSRAHSFTVIGQPLTFSSDLASLVPVIDPVATLVGGRFGIVEIDGQSFCVDGERCADPVDPVTLDPLVRAVGEPNDGHEAASLAAGSTAAAAPVFSINSSLSVDTTDSLLWGVVPNYTTRVTAQTRQGYGGFRVIEALYYQTAKVECHFVGVYPMILKVCVAVPRDPIVLKSTGQNFLSAEIRYFSNTYNKPKCEQKEYWGSAPYFVSGWNVPWVTVSSVYSSRLPTAGWYLDAYLTFPSKVRSDHSGHDRKFPWPNSDYEILYKFPNLPKECRP